jgi:hypothetical protein
VNECEKGAACRRNHPGRARFRPRTHYNSRMAEPARRPPVAEESPPLDPRAVDRAYRQHRARRRARAQHNRNARLAGIRFWLFLAALLALAVFLGLTVWHQIQHLFGL